jgi:hypothetical protein
MPELNLHLIKPDPDGDTTQNDGGRTRACKVYNIVPENDIVDLTLDDSGDESESEDLDLAGNNNADQSESEDVDQHGKVAAGTG